MPFPSLIMGLIVKAKMKISSGLTVVQRDYPIGAHTVNRSTAHIKGSKTSVHTIPQNRVEDEGGDTEEEIDRFTSAPKSSAQPSSSAPARGPDKLDHILAKTVDRTTLRNCIPFYRLISRILKLKGVYPSENERPYPRPSPISICTLHASMSHTKKNPKQESPATQGSSSSTSHVYDERLDNILVTLQEITTKISGLATIMYSQHNHFDTKFTSLQTQLDQIQRKLEEHGD